DGNVFVADDPAILDPALPVGLGKLSLVGPPVGRILSGPTDAAGRPAADTAVTNDPTPTFTVSGDGAPLECSLVPAGADPVWADCSAGSFTPAAPLPDGDYGFGVRALAADGPG